MLREISATVRRERMEVMTSDLFDSRAVDSRAVVLTHVWGRSSLLLLLYRRYTESRVYNMNAAVFSKCV